MTILVVDLGPLSAPLVLPVAPPAVQHNDVASQVHLVKGAQRLFHIGMLRPHAHTLSVVSVTCYLFLAEVLDTAPVSCYVTDSSL